MSKLAQFTPFSSINIPSKWELLIISAKFLPLYCASIYKSSLTWPWLLKHPELQDLYYKEKKETNKWIEDEWSQAEKAMKNNIKQTNACALPTHDFGLNPSLTTAVQLQLILLFLSFQLKSIVMRSCVPEYFVARIWRRASSDFGVTRTVSTCWNTF